MSVSCSDRVDPHCSQESESRPVTHCQTVPETVGSDGSCIQRNTSWPAVHEITTVVTQNQGVFLEGKPTLHDQDHMALPTCLRHVGVLGTRCRRLMLTADASLTDTCRLGRLRAVPSGEEQCTPHHIVPVSAQHHREIDLLTLPPTVLQGTAVSSDRISQHPPGIEAVLGGLPPLRRSLEQLDRPFPAGHPFQGIELATLVLHTEEEATESSLVLMPPPPMGLPSLVGPEQALVMEQEVHSLEEGAIKVVPPLAESPGSTAGTSLFRKRMVRGCVLDLCQLNRAVMGLRFIHFGGEAYQYRVLQSSLALSPCTFTKCADAAVASLKFQSIRILNYQRFVDVSSFRADGVSTSRCCSRLHERAGVKTKTPRKVCFSTTVDRLSGHGVRFNHGAGTSGLLYMGPLQWSLQDQEETGFALSRSRGNAFVP
ncbi:Zinc finger protein 462 [Labeo rohita]|uniref:Zinc finger protein 462 n=1 Tax=Labeo rohita TaxID=84645 RepID=A0ABQ8L7L4_LABRO|nr:Zinc finger protein 462 [Labeo rohita]